MCAKQLGNFDVLLAKSLGQQISNIDLSTVTPLIKRDKVEKPVIFIGAGTCGLGAGAGQTIEATRKYISEKNIEADIIEVGCIGLCSAEPLASRSHGCGCIVCVKPRNSTMRARALHAATAQVPFPLFVVHAHE